MARAKRRGASGGGTIRQRADGRWEARITIGRDPVTGKQKQRSFYGATQREVRQKLQQAAVEVDAGTYVEPNRMTLDQWLNTWLTEYKSGLRASSRETYLCVIRNRILPLLGREPLQSITPAKAQRFANALFASGLSYNSVSLATGILYSAFDRAARLGLTRSNPFALIELPQKPRHTIEPLSIAQLTALLDAARSDTIYHAIALDAFTGLRASELCGLTWRQVDYDRRVLLIDQQLGRADGSYTLLPTKNGKERLVPLAQTAIDVLRDRRRQQITDRLAAGSLWHEPIPGLVFTQSTGRPLTRTIFGVHIRQLGRAIGVPSLSPHDLRHTYAVNALHAGVSYKDLQAALGHSSAAFTLDVYGHVTDDTRATSADRIEAFLNSQIFHKG